MNLGEYGCDDGNNIDGDGCSSTCEVEDGWICSTYPHDQPSVCFEVCGNGINNGQLECDDGNLRWGDG